MLQNYAPIHPKIVSLNYEGFYVLRLSKPSSLKPPCFSRGIQTRFRELDHGSILKK